MDETVRMWRNAMITANALNISFSGTVNGQVEWTATFLIDGTSATGKTEKEATEKLFFEVYMLKESK